MPSFTKEGANNEALDPDGGKSRSSTKEAGRYLLHSLENSGVATHAQVIVRAPDVDFIDDTSRMGDGELGSETIDVVEVTVALVLMFLLELGIVK
jgi:hypothetical protein